MASDSPTTVRLEAEVLKGLREVRERDGMPVSEQIRRALRAWLEEKGVSVKADRKRSAKRRRP